MIADNESPEPSGAGRAPMNDAQDRAEELDDTTLRLDPNGTDHEGLPGVNATVDHVPMHSEDPSLLLGGSETQDDARTRAWRERPEVGDAQGTARTDRPPVGDLVTPADADDNGRDIEKTMVAEPTSGHDGATPAPAEVAAVNLVEGEPN